MNTFKQLIGGIILLLVSTGCGENTNRLNALKAKNYNLKQELDVLQNDNNEEQLAIFEYILFVDSVDKLLNGVLIDFVSIQNNERKYEYDKKQLLLNKLSNLVAILDSEQNKINDLEKNISIQNSQYKKEYEEIVEALKKEKILLLERITSMQVKIEDLIIKFEKQKVQIQDQHDQIQGQNEIIVNQSLKIEKAEKILKKRYVILVSRKTTKKVELAGTHIDISKKSKKIQVQTQDEEYCSMLDLPNNQTRLIIDEQFWEYSEILTVRIAGRY